MTLVKNRVGRRRDLVRAFNAAIEPAPCYPVKISMAAFGADKSVGPSKSEKQLTTLPLCLEAFSEFNGVNGFLLHSYTSDVFMMTVNLSFYAP
jgi:hypothetical protein